MQQQISFSIFFFEKIIVAADFTKKNNETFKLGLETARIDAAVEKLVYRCPLAGGG
jgi:hypothetical protein